MLFQLILLLKFLIIFVLTVLKPLSYFLDFLLCYLHLENQLQFGVSSSWQTNVNDSMLTPLKLSIAVAVLLVKIRVIWIRNIDLFKEFREMEPNLHFQKSWVLGELVNFKILAHDREIFHGHWFVVDGLDVLVVDVLESVKDVNYDQRGDDVCYDDVVGDDVLVSRAAQKVVVNKIATAPVNEQKLVWCQWILLIIQLSKIFTYWCLIFTDWSPVFTEIRKKPVEVSVSQTLRAPIAFTFFKAVFIEKILNLNFSILVLKQ